ncbi:MAG: nucleotide sugar dehydrogenase [Candidatus Berkelbacteria bacterium]
MVQESDNLIISVVGLGYVGLPLALEFAKNGVKVIGFDVKAKRIEELKRNFDESEEIASEDLVQGPIEYTTDPASINRANFVIVAIPTPVDEANEPDLTLLEKASATIGQNLTKEAVVVFESTVYPGVTEDICVPIIEKESGLKCGEDWFIGYSPERVNPGDKEHAIGKIVKIVSGMDEKTLERVAQVYGLACKGGVHKAPSIKVAEAAKIFENIQRDVNIALVNELSLICNRLNIATKDVLAATATKWNALKFRPGLVGGHCIGVDPFYLVAKAESLGYHPQVITAGRRINDYMPEFVAEEVVKGLVEAGKPISGTKVLVMGLTFKENIRDMRNSKITVTIKKLQELGIEIVAYDPNLTQKEIKTEFGLDSISEFEGKFGAIIVGVPHDQFKDLGGKILNVINGKPVIFDINSLYVELAQNKDVVYKSL